MKISDIKLGEKYYPLAGPLHGDECGYWIKAKQTCTPYLYCTGLDVNKNRVLLNFHYNEGVGSWYSSKVLIPFVRLTKEDLVVGNKYVPIAKTSGTWAEEEFEKYGVMAKAIDMEQPYLYYTGWDEDGYACMDVNQRTDSQGDYYNPEDLLPYVGPYEPLFKNRDMNTQKPSDSIII